jgi:hypothetical protein
MKKIIAIEILIFVGLVFSLAVLWGGLELKNILDRSEIKVANNDPLNILPPDKITYSVSQTPFFQPNEIKNILLTVTIILLAIAYPLRGFALAFRWALLTLKQSNSLTLNKPE